jgi:hypothetical protein
MEKLDLRKQYKDLYQPSAKKVVLVEVPSFPFIMIDGQIEAGCAPENSPSLQQAFELLYGIAYTLKFASKLRAENPIDYKVMAMEGLWWTPGGGFDMQHPENWHWTAMILQPDHITPEMFAEAQAQLKQKKPHLPVEKLRLERFHEGLCVQIMHIGPYADEPPTIARMHTFAAENGYGLRGKHHEIYLGDPRRTAPERLKTVLRQPIAPAE